MNDDGMAACECPSEVFDVSSFARHRRSEWHEGWLGCCATSVGRATRGRGCFQLDTIERHPLASGVFAIISGDGNCHLGAQQIGGCSHERAVCRRVVKVSSESVHNCG